MKLTDDQSNRVRLEGKQQQQALKAMRAAHRPAVAVTGPYGRPFHPLIATVPIGAWVCTVAFDVASKLSDGRAYARAAGWLCAIGIASSLVSAAIGMIDARRITAGTLASRGASVHRTLMVIALLLFVVSFIIRRMDASSYSYLLDGTPVAAFVLSVIGLIVLIAGAMAGGRLVFSYGVRVMDEDDQINAYLVSEKDDVEPGAPRSAAVRASKSRDESTS